MNNLLKELRNIKIVNLTTQYVKRREQKNSKLFDRLFFGGIFLSFMSLMGSIVLDMMLHLNMIAFLSFVIGVPTLSLCLGLYIYEHYENKNNNEGLQEVINDLSDKQVQKELLNLLYEKECKDEKLNDHTDNLTNALSKENYIEAATEIYNIVCELENKEKNKDSLLSKEQETRNKREENQNFLSSLNIELEKKLGLEKEINGKNIFKKML